MWSDVDSSMTLHALLGPRDRDNRFLSRFLKKTDYPPGPPPGEGEMHLPSPEAVPALSGSHVPRPPAPTLTASRRGPGRDGAACLHLARRHRSWRLLRMRCGSGGGCRGPPSETSSLGAATGGLVEAAAARRGRKC